MAKPTKKSIKSSVKVRNKMNNKANKGKKRKLMDKKSKKASNEKISENFEDDSKLFRGSKFNDEEGLDELVVNKNRRAKKRQAESDLGQPEAKYQASQSLIKQLGDEKKKKTLALPIKTISGQLIKNVQILDIEEKDEKKEIELEKVNEEVKSEDEPPKSALDIIREKKDFFDKSKSRIAFLCRGILENPHGEMKKLKELRQMLTQTNVRQSYILRKLVIVSLCEIFKDIIPSYKIRAWTEKEIEQKIGTEVKELREYEETLLKQYKLFLDYLNESIKEINKTLYKSKTKINKSTEETVKSFGVVCVRSVCQMLEKLNHFNYANDLIDMVVSQLTSSITDISSLASETIKSIFTHDKTLHLSLEITQKITKVLKQKSFGVRADLLDIFLSLRIKEIKLIEEDKSKKMKHKDKMKLSRSERKKQKEKEQLEAELEDKKISDKLKEKSRLQARILEQIFMIYFRILKKSPNFKLFPSVLEGLCKFAHLINLDFFEDLLKLMHQMIESDKLSFRSKLHCIKTIFVVLSGQGEALTIDPMKFYTSLYNILLCLNASGNIDNIYLLADCIDMMFLKRRRQVPTSRLLAFIKRLTVVSLQLEPAATAVILNILRKLININKSTDLLFDNEYQDSGIYNPELPEPDYSNSQNSALWEFHIMRRHYNKLIVDDSSEFLKPGNSNGLSENKMNVDEILKIIKEFDDNFMNQPLNYGKKFKKK